MNLDELKGKLDADEVLASLGIKTAQRLGSWIMCHCPFTENHANGDKNPSFGFNEDSLSWNCFVCGKGTLLDLVQYCTGAKDDYGWLMNHLVTEPPKEEFINDIEELLAPKEEKVVPLPEYPTDLLFQYRKIHPYLLERGISKETIISHQVGFSDEHHGIVIPHFFLGKLRGMQYRHLHEVAPKEYVCETCSKKLKKVPKYVNTDDFPKKISLYNYDNRLPRMIVCESPMSVLYLDSQGIQGAVATFGLFSNEQKNLMLAQQSVYFWPDNDSVGRDLIFQEKSPVHDLAYFVNVHLVPVGTEIHADPADVPGDMLEEYLESAIPYGLWPLLKGKLPTLGVAKSLT